MGVISEPRVSRRSQNTADHHPTLRVLEVLDALSQHTEGCTLTDLASITGASKSTLVPILKTMLRHRFIAFRSDRRYAIGMKTFSVGSAFVEGEPLIGALRSEMERVVAVCQETCQLGVLDGNHVFYIAKIDSPQAIRLISSIGKRIPAYCTALGKALLSDRDAREIEELFPDGLAPMTPHTITSVPELCEQIADQRTDGVFTEYEESCGSVVCFAVPLCQRGRIVAAVSISVPRFRLDDEKETQIRQLLAGYRVTAERMLEAYPEDGLLAN